MVNAMKAGDMVVHPSTGRVGLLMDVVPNGFRPAYVMFVNDGPWFAYKLDNLRRATTAEIEAARLDGVGCNQASE
jgi:hypothetical protein